MFLPRCCLLCLRSCTHRILGRQTPDEIRKAFRKDKFRLRLTGLFCCMLGNSRRLHIGLVLNVRNSCMDLRKGCHANHVRRLHRLQRVIGKIFAVLRDHKQQEEPKKRMQNMADASPDAGALQRSQVGCHNHPPQNEGQDPEKD